jgi:hypothetical protein
MTSKKTLVNLLADLYETQSKSRRVVDDAGLNSAYIEFKDNAKDNWHNILTEAKKRNRVMVLVEIVCEEYPEKERELRTALQPSTTHSPFRSQVEADDQSERSDISPNPPSQDESQDKSGGKPIINTTVVNPQYKYDVFLSHRSDDKPLVEALAQRLEDKEGLRPFLDKWHLVPGEPWQEALEKALDSSATCAVFLGPSGLGTWENEELRSALDDRVHNRSLRVIPVLLPGADIKDKTTLPRFLRLLAWVDFRSGLDDREAFRRLVAGIQGKAPGR